MEVLFNLKATQGKRFVRLAGIGVIAILLSACAGKPAPLSASSSFHDAPSFVAAQPEASVDTFDAQEMQSLIDETTRVVLSDAFGRNLSSIEEPIALSPFGPRVSSSTVLTLLLG